MQCYAEVIAGFVLKGNNDRLTFFLAIGSDRIMISWV